jgi:translation initiation factor IF-1
MSGKAQLETSLGTIIEALPNALFRVQIKGTDEVILAYLSGKMRLNRIKVLIGDSVEVLIDKYGGKGRIITRIDTRHQQQEKEQ